MMSNIRTIATVTARRLLTNASLSSQGSRLQFDVAITLISIVPLLTLFHVLQRPSEYNMWVVGGILSLIACLGYVLLLKYPRTIVKLRHHMEQIARGELSDQIDLREGESDISAIQICFNQVIAGMKERITVIEEQSKRLMAVERQRVMTESLCTACHRLGQPATTIGCYLDLLREESLSSAGSDYLANCLDEATVMRDILTELQGITEYRTEAYAEISTQQQAVSPRIILTPHDKAA